MGYVLIEKAIRDFTNVRLDLQDHIKFFNALLESRGCRVYVDEDAYFVFEMKSDAKDFHDFCKNIPFTIDFARHADKIIQIRSDGKKKVLKSRYGSNK